MRCKRCKRKTKVRGEASTPRFEFDRQRTGQDSGKSRHWPCRDICRFGTRTRKLLRGAPISQFEARGPTNSAFRRANQEAPRGNRLFGGHNSAIDAFARSNPSLKGGTSNLSVNTANLQVSAQLDFGSMARTPSTHCDWNREPTRPLQPQTLRSEG